MEFKGTQDDWIADYSYESETYISCNGLRIAEVKHYKHYDLNDPSTEEGRANAKLIAAAPELLKALQLVADELFQAIECINGLESAKLSTTIKKADEAINKALN
jgi:hypothetical protein